MREIYRRRRSEVEFGELIGLRIIGNGDARLGPGFGANDRTGLALVNKDLVDGAFKRQWDLLRLASSIGNAQDAAKAAVELLDIESVGSSLEIAQDGLAGGYDDLGMGDVGILQAGA